MSAEGTKMPNASAWRTRYRSEPGMIGHYPWTYTDSELRTRRVDQQNYEVEPLYTATQVQALLLASRKEAMEEAAKVCDGLVHALDHAGVSYHRPADAERCARAIRALADVDAKEKGEKS